MSADLDDYEMLMARAAEQWAAMSRDEQIASLRANIETFDDMPGCEDIAAGARAELAALLAPTR